MATATNTHDDRNPTADQVPQLNERLLASGKRVGNLYLDSYEKFIESATAYQQKVAESFPNETLQSLVTTQVGLTRKLTSAYTSAARELIA